MTKTIKAAAAASLLFALCAGAQEDEGPTTYVIGEGGEATHNESGAVCPATIGELVLAQVMSYDSATMHYGIRCQYASANGFLAGLSVLRLSAPELLGPGTPAARWNASLYQTLGSYPGALPANVAGLEGDESTGLRGALFNASGNGVPLRIGVWQIEDSDWQYAAEAMFVPMTSAGWEVASETRAALLSFKSAADAS